MFIKECKKILLSIPYWLFVIVMILNFFQVSFPEKIEPPKPDQESYSDYGYTYGDGEDKIIDAALNELYFEITRNSFTTYPLGFYKQVRLNDSNREKVAELLADLAKDMTAKDILNGVIPENSPNSTAFYTDENGNMVPFEADDPDIPHLQLKNDKTYSEFEKVMQEIDDAIGGGSQYNKNNLLNFDYRPLNYQEAVTQYDYFKKTDRYSNAYARLFSDYMTIFASLIPVFIAVAETMRDRRHKMRDIIWSRKTSSLKTAFTRFFAIISCCMIPILLLSVINSAVLVNLYSFSQIDILAYLKYSFGWIMPSIMISTAIGLIITEMTDTPIAILIMALWWFIDFSSSNTLIGNYASQLLTLTPRHNSIMNGQIFENGKNLIVQNRLIYTLISLVLTALSAFVMKQKRKGKWFAYDDLKAYLGNNKKKS